jgi:carboxymethylenebutenolidase
MSTTDDISFEVDGATVVAALARPATPNGRAVIVIHEWWGLNDHTRDVTGRFAELGYTALAPDLYGGVVTADAQQASRLMHALDTEHALHILRTAVDVLVDLNGVSPAHLGVIGFCMGGSFALLLACRDDRIKAAAPFYGDIPDDSEIARLGAPVLFIGASKDTWITPAKMAALRDSLARHGKRGEVKIYPGAKHAFFNDTRNDVYDAVAAADAWQRVLDFFDDNL